MVQLGEKAAATRVDVTLLLMGSKRQECDQEWLDFGLQPGTRLVWVRTGVLRSELRTAEQQTVASVRNSAFRGREHLSAGGKTFTIKPVPRSWRPGHEDLWPTAPWPRFQLLDKARTPILYTGSAQADAYIKFPGRGYLRFPVRGTSRGNATMTAVDQGLNQVARYRLVWN